MGDDRRLGQPGGAGGERIDGRGVVQRLDAGIDPGLRFQPGEADALGRFPHGHGGRDQPGGGEAGEDLPDLRRARSPVEGQHHGTEAPDREHGRQVDGIVAHHQGGNIAVPDSGAPESAGDPTGQPIEIPVGQA